jgi:hypothetical protein
VVYCVGNPSATIAARAEDQQVRGGRWGDEGQGAGFNVAILGGSVINDDQVVIREVTRRHQERHVRVIDACEGSARVRTAGIVSRLAGQELVQRLLVKGSVAREALAGPY